jgi:beta-mannosidase
MNRAGRGRVRSVSDTESLSLEAGWEVVATPPGAVDAPAALGTAAGWIPTVVPSTVASSLRAAGVWSLDAPARRFDAEDWWYRLRFSTAPLHPDESAWLVFDGVATVADAWINDIPLLSAVGMFTAHQRRVDHQLRPDNELVIRFRSLDALLAVRRPRPRWRAPMVEHQQLRWFRTTLLGRTPGWSPPVAPVGPWRGVRLERRRGATLHDVRISANAAGLLHVSCEATCDDDDVLGAEVVLTNDGLTHRAALRRDADQRWSGALTVGGVERWWPHTHGAAPLYALRLLAHHGRGTSQVDLGDVGFRDITVDQRDGGFSLTINDVPVFCRGACWTPIDPVSLSASPSATDEAVAQVMDCGMNMLRVAGPMVYESDDFLDACDRRGILIWQDFMFANMDYPDQDAGFLDAALVEVRQQLARWQGRPSLAVLCGNSEVEQQAAMWGASRDRWAPPLFHETLATLAGACCPDVPYWPSSAHGGAFPHDASAGTASYYGVGAYRRGLDDARRADVRFATECLAFANLPSERRSSRAALKVHHPAWKARTPRDLGAGWDFDDVRDHYLAQLFRVDPVALRSADHDRYLALGRVVTGEVMAAVFSEWRRARSRTRGGLVWFWRDLWEGAGWGLIGADGTPKPAWYYLRRALAPLAISLSDEGGNGVAVHVVNDTPERFTGSVDLEVIRQGELRVAQGSRPITVEPHSAVQYNALDWFDGFWDLSYAYRFGPRSHDIVSSTLRSDREGSSAVGRAFSFVGGLPNTRELEVGIAARVEAGDDRPCRLVVQTRRFAQSVAVAIEGYTTDDNYFHLAPGETRHLMLQRLATAPGGPVRGTLQPLNAETATPIAVGG